MKNTIIILLVLFCQTGYAQLYDDFSDGNFTANPVWSGSSSGGDFSVFNNRLRSGSNKASANFYLSTTNSLGINCSWEFWINLQFSTSGSNYADVYLVSDKADLQSNQINGYFVRIGNTDDEISLYKRSGTPASSIKIIDGVNGSVAASNNTVRIRVSRDQPGKFTLEREVAGINSSFVSEGTFIDLSHINTSSFGIYIQQSTSSFFQKHFFDDFRIGTLNTDTIAPMLNMVTVLDSTTLEATFSEAMDSLSIQNKLNFSISNFPGQIVQINTGTDPLKCKIRLSEPLSTGIFLLTVSNVKDRNGNNIRNNNTYSLKYIKPYRVKYKDIAINEVFPDPSPQIDLPSVEYVELINTTNETISLHNWRFSDPSSGATLGNISMIPKSFLILCAKSDTAEFQKFGNVLGISPWPSLNNGGDILKLKNSENILIDSLSYSDLWYRTPEKKQGGWSLERIDPTSLCEGSFNWKASMDSAGGTPGKQNSVYLPNYDLSALKADSISRKSDSTLHVYFNKPLNSATILKENFTLLPSSGQIKKTSPDADYKQIEITFSEKFIAGKSYILNLSGFKDCSGNTIPGTASQFSFSLPAPPPPKAEKPDTAKMFITEVFADPSPEIGLPLVEYVEIYNPGTDTVDLEGWSISDTQTKGVLKSSLLPPKQYLILCPAADALQYKNFGRTTGISPWPSLTNNSDQIILKSFRNRTVDSIAYSNTWYGDAVKKQGGWSLERIDALSKCTGGFNWTASEDSSGGTPGRQNSVHVPNFDLEPFKSDSINRKSDSALHIYFNKYPDTTSIQDTSFKLSPEAGQIQKISAGVNSKELIIKFSEKFKAGNNYKLSISSMKDCSGNILSSSSSKFSFSLAPLPPPPAEKPDTAKIFITEIFADPSPEVGLPLVEFVEIFNPGNDTINLEGWSLSDLQTKSIIKSSLLAPKQYLILCPAADTAQYKNFGKTAGMSSWPSLSNSLDQVILKSFKSRTVDSISYSDQWYGDAMKKQGGWSLERIDALSKCTGFYNWTASNNASGGTPGKQNSVYVSNYDFLPLKADSISRTSDSTLYVFFNKSIEIKPINPENFSLSPAAGKAKNISDDTKHERLKITFSEKFAAGKTYELSITDIKDCSGNMINSSTRFSFSLAPLPPVPAEKPDTARVLITEIFADPSPEVRLPLVEFIEIYNPGGDTVNLEGWTISDSQTKSTLKKILIAPEQYLILCPIADTTQFKSYGKTAGISPWPSLGNNEDRIFLRSFKNRMVDSVSYSDSWYKNQNKKSGGWSLEIIDLSSKTCSGFYNWAASIDPDGGTPGRINSRYFSGYLNEALKIDSVNVLSDSTVTLFFNRIPNTGFLKAPNFQITNGIGKAKFLSIRPDFIGITLEFNQKFKEGIKYTLSADSLYSCSGALSSSSHRQISFSIPVIPEIDYPLIINEIFADPSPVYGLPEAEFVELFNPTQNTVNLKGLNFGDQVSNYSLKNGEIAAGSYIILCAEKDTAIFKPFGKVIGLQVWPDLNNETDVLLLKSNKGRELQQVRYDSGWYRDAEKKKGGYSLELIDPMSICLSFQNWTASRDSSGGTPGRENSVYQPDYKPEALKLTGAELIDSLSISLTFNRAVDNLKAIISSNYTLNNGAGSPMSSRLAGIYFDKVILTLKEPLTRGQTYRIRVNNISDCRNTPISAEFSSLEFTLSKKIEKNDILITEILFNPRPGGADFVEIYNNSGHSLDLKDLSIARIIKDSINSIQQLSNKQFLFEPGNYLALTPDPENIKKEYFPKNPASILKIIPFPAFNDDTGTAVLISKGQKIDQLSYTEKMHFPLLKNTEGISLERSKLKRPSAEPGNLRSATSASGFATPGYQNSQYSEDLRNSDEFSLVSKTFSPDNDGFEDLLEVTYKFSQPGKIANVSIFNDSGILVKKLLKNFSMNTEGSFIWDGFTEQSQPASSGIYLLQAEIFDTEGQIRKFSKPFVLAVKFK